MLEIDGSEIHLASYPEGDLFLHQIHTWVKDNKVVRAERHDKGKVFPLKVKPAREGGMHTLFEAMELSPAQTLTVGSKTHTITHI